MNAGPRTPAPRSRSKPICQTVTCHLAQNAVTKEFAKNRCAEKKKVKATGTVKTVNGKPELTPTKIELVKS